MSKDTKVKSIFVKEESNFINQWGEFNENSPTLSTGVTARLDAITNDFHVLNIDETENGLDAIGWHVNADGRRWWSDQANQVFGTENGGGSYPWSIYKQTNIYTTARKYAGKNSKYGLHIFRYPNIASTSTWGGLCLYPPANTKIVGKKFRFSFDYRGDTGGANLDVYQNHEIGWGTMGIGLPGPWGQSISPFNTWEWQRYEKEFEITSELANFIPGSNQQVWDSTKSYTGSYYGVQYNGYVYRHFNGGVSKIGETPEDTYNSGDRTVWNGRHAMVPNAMDLYRQIKIGFTYNTQGDKGTHVFVDNIQLTEITENSRFKFNDSKWEADNISEETTHIKAIGTGHVSQPQASNASVDIFDTHSSRSLEVNGTQIYNSGSRGLRLTIILESDSSIVHDQSYDVYGYDAPRIELANKLKTIGDGYLWVLTSYDAVATNTTLNTQMESMGSVLYLNDGNEYSIFSGSGVRHPYAALGRGQKVIKEDGANANEPIYKRMGVIDLRV